jgi:glucose-1-phosphate cytidylyltransferase
MTGGRVKRVRELLGGERFLLTYGDGVSDVNIDELVAAYKKSGAAATLTAAQPPGRFGALDLSKDSDRIASFNEKPTGDGKWIKSGFFVVEPKALDYIPGDETAWERAALSACSGREALRPSPRRLLASNGYPSRQARARGLVEQRQSAVADLGRVIRPVGTWGS